MITIPTFGWLTLTEAINKIIAPNTFLASLFFKKVKTHPTTAVQVDIRVGRQKLAPFVKRGNEAKVVGLLGQKTSTIEPPNIRLKKALTAQDLLFTRGSGLPTHVPGGTGEVIANQRKRKIAEEQVDLQHIVTRTIEWMVAQGLGGAYTITQDDLGFSIDFQMPTANKPVLTGGALWSASTTCKPIDNLRDWKNVVKKGSGKVPTAAVMTTEVFNNFINAEQVQKYLDKRNIKIGEIKTDANILSMGAEKVAHIENVDFYTYDEIYVDGSGTQHTMLANTKFYLGAPNAENRLHYGAIEDLEAASVVGKYFSKDWVTKDPSNYWLLVESHPLPAFHEPEAFICATVQ